MRKTVLLAGLGTLGIAGLLLQSAPALARPGSANLLASQVFTVPGPNADAKFASAIDNMGDVLTAFIDNSTEDHVSLSRSHRWGHLSFDASTDIPGFNHMHMDIVMSAVSINCAPGVTGWNVELDLRKSSPNISNNYNQMNLQICGIQRQGNGSLSVPVKGYLIEGPRKNWLEAEAVSLQIKHFLPKAAQVMTRLFQNGK